MFLVEMGDDQILSSGFKIWLLFLEVIVHV